MLKSSFISPMEEKNRTDIINWLKALSTSERKISIGKKVTKTEYDTVSEIIKYIKNFENQIEEMKVV